MNGGNIMGVSEKLLSAFWKMTEKGDNIRIDRQQPPEGITAVCDIPYAADNEKRHLLDVYYPEGTEERLPVIIDIHGGGWMYGYKEINKYYNMFLASRGFTVISINYGLAPDYSYKMQLMDCFTAFHWFDKNADAYPCDKNNVFLTGDSAGGHLAALCCEIFGREDLPEIFNVNLPDFEIRAAAFTCGAFSMPYLLSNIQLPLARSYARYILGADMRDPKANRFADACALLDAAKMPPLFLSSSAQDFIGFETKKFCKKLQELHIPYKLMFWPKGKEYALPHVFNIIEPWYDESILTNIAMTDFLKKHIR